MQLLNFYTFPSTRISSIPPQLIKHRIVNGACHVGLNQTDTRCEHHDIHILEYLVIQSCFMGFHVSWLQPYNIGPLYSCTHITF